MSNKKEINAIILAAGKGTRMRSEHLKVMHKVGGNSIISYVINSIKALSPIQLYVVVGHQKETLISRLQDNPLL